ncbi:NUDIX domain-containing protein [Belliella kenyensis]|uniref:GDP-mannose pyrophosphatase n=1 Tax=Belliella kenyensis TaxID=1472724 RepID=A0ABV8ELW9_9BACT|nr:NUDIX hydrolase [Belliella kenyensis]MCH7402981.1 NUDIX hydrolase [Belliella kenyensis]MDN3605017.1 NUDIX hydrolase [Belliella kenyensis]
MENPWKTLSIQTVFENPWIEVTHRDVIIPSGKPGTYGMVHFKNKALGIIPVDEEGNTWLVGQFRYTLNEYSWEIPMGGGILEEDDLINAQRELKEETGLIAERWTEIMKIHTSNSVTDESGVIYLAEGLTQGETEFEETEQLEIIKLPLKEAVEKVMKGEITDAISIAGLLKVAKLFDI